MAWEICGYTGDTGRALACDTACRSSCENGGAFLTAGAPYTDFFTGGSENFAAYAVWISGEPMKATSFSAAPGFFKYAEITLLCLPSTPALPPPSKAGCGATAHLPLTLPAFSLSAKAYGQLRM